MVWLTSEFGVTPRRTALAAALAERGVEVWAPDCSAVPHTDRQGGSGEFLGHLVPALRGRNPLPAAALSAIAATGPGDTGRGCRRNRREHAQIPCRQADRLPGSVGSRGGGAAALGHLCVSHHPGPGSGHRIRYAVFGAFDWSSQEVLDTLTPPLQPAPGGKTQPLPVN